MIIDLNLTAMVWLLTLRWTRYFYTTTLPKMRESGWPQLQVGMGEHPQSLAVGTFDGGKSFFSGQLSKPVRDSILNLRYGDVKKAGVESHQRAAAATAWLLTNAGGRFNNIKLAWTGPFMNFTVCQSDDLYCQTNCT